jgi:multidrug efflux system membrane fusion protein
MVPSTRAAPLESSADVDLAESTAPQIVHEERDVVPRRGGWLWLVGWGLLAAVGWYFWPAVSPWLTVIGLGPTASPKSSLPRITPVGTSVVQQRDFPLYLNGLGTVTALKTVTVRSRVEGEVTRIHFAEGEMVSEGDLLAEIDPRPFQVLKEQAEGQLARDEATLRAARLNLSRLQQLRDAKIATAQQVDDQQALVEQYEGVIKADLAQIAQAELQLTYCKILAPIRGRIGLRLVDEGNIIRPTDPEGLAVITQLQPITVVFTIPQDEVARVQRRMLSEETLVVEAYDRDLKNLLATGRLTAIDNQVDPLNGTVKLKAEFENSDGLLFPNQFVNVRLRVEQLTGAVVAPSAAVQRGPNGPYVYVVTPEETVELREVAVSAVEGGETALASGVAAGETVVTSGLDRLQPGAKVTTGRSAAGDGPGGSGKRG